MESKVYNQKGKDAGSISLPENIFGLKWNSDLVHQVVHSMMSNQRAGTADTKGRGEVRGGGKKPWKQKGTGRARHGSTRSPIWVGGGVAHGPLAEKNYDRKINKKMKAKAVYTILSKKLSDGELMFVDTLSFDGIKTKTAISTLEALSKVSGFENIATKKRNSAYITVPEAGETIKKSFSNLSAISLKDVSMINPLDLIKFKYIIIANPEKSIAFLEGKMAKSTKVVAKSDI
ncbi:MAG: 50S ribosomal protein L4 [Candidatus Paceibacterota bacterium]|jgi:large subunit ribosomal protein L4